MMIPTSFSQLIGNEKIKEYLQRMVEKEMITHSLLFAGPEGIGKSLFAQALAAELICKGEQGSVHRYKLERGQHPDLHHYRPEGKLGLHSVQSLRQFNDEVHLSPYEAEWKVFFIHEAERMLHYSANALLKTFEEPPPRTIIILISNNPKALLPTILSRCNIVRFQPITEQEIAFFLKERRHSADDSLIQIAARLSQGSLARAIQLAEGHGEHGRAVLFKFLSEGQLWNYKALTSCVNELIGQIESLKKRLEEEAKESQATFSTEDLPVLQQQALEKELEAAIAIKVGHEFQALLENLLSWYRDLHLLHLGGEACYLLNPDYQFQLEQFLQRGGLIPLETVQTAIDEALLAFQRSTSPHICLENLFLKLS